MTSLKSYIDHEQQKGYNFKGAFLVPIHVYTENGSNHKLRGKTCVFMGKEKWGSYKDSYNFFGGKVDRGERVIGTLLREIREELCEDITLEQLEHCIVGLKSVRFQSQYNVTLLVFAHIGGLSHRRWETSMNSRIDKTRRRCMFEMSKVKHFAIDDLDRTARLSKLVDDNIHRLKSLARSINRVPLLHVSKIRKFIV